MDDEEEGASSKKRKPKDDNSPEAVGARLQKACGELVDVRLPEACEEPILAPVVRRAVIEWMTEIHMASELRDVGLSPRYTSLLYGPPGCGKEQPLTSKILTPVGWKTMGEMRIGAPICGSDGRTYQVTGVYPQGVKAAYRVTFTDGTSAEAGADHLWVVKGHHGSRDGWLVRSTLQLMSGNARGRNARNFRIPIAEAIEFSPSASLPISPYVLGALIGDGALTLNTVALSVPAAKEPIRLKVEALLGEEYEMTAYNVTASAPQWHISGGKRRESTMKAIVKSLGLSVKSSERSIPEIYKLSSVADRVELLRGLMDSDGSASKGRTSFSTLSSNLADDVCDLVRSLGGVAIPHKYWREDHFEWSINVRLKECPFSIVYKAEGWIAPKFNFGKHIKNIEYVGDVEQQCIKISAPNCLYVTDGFNVTHNTTLAHHFAARLGMPLVIARGELVHSRWVGATGENIGRLFNNFRVEQGHFVGFFDELDSLASTRGSTGTSAGKEQNSIVAALLTNIEAFEGIFFAATNRQESLDPAIWRRFGMQLEVALPGFEERFAILRRYGLPFEFSDDFLDELSVQTETSAPSLLRQVMEGFKRALIIGPRLKRDISNPAIILRGILAAVRPHPDYSTPPLWSSSKAIDGFAKFKGDNWPPSRKPGAAK